jgi:ABC-type lipoprotein release transport system permease subunit
VAFFSNTGIDLGMFAEGLSEYGLSFVIYPELEALYYLNIALLMVGATLLSSLYPAWKALQLNPVQAIRKI